MRKKPKKDIKDTLFDYVTDKTRWFYWYHNPDRLKELYKSDHEEDEKEKKEKVYTKDNCNFTKRVWRFESEIIEITNPKTGSPEHVVIEKNLADFFDAELDEVRIKKANAFAEYALYISDNEDLAYFRDTVTRREIAADIDYNKQRDHAVHTLYNYLLGWYIFEHSKDLYEAFQNHFNKLKINLDAQNINLTNYYKDFKEVKIPEESAISIGLIHEFADVWPIASLLHDIGYILEGHLSSANPEVEHLRVTNGSKIIHDYFNHFFWKSFEVDFRVAKNIATTLGVVVPDFRHSKSLASLGDRLCDIGSCENIRSKLKENNREFEKSPYPPILEDHGLNREAFSIWKEHYNFYEDKSDKCTKKMADILSIVERVYKNMMWVGADHGNRNLDHGVCSGLITLQALTFFRELFWGFCSTDWNSFNQKQGQSLENTHDQVSQQLFEHIKDEITRVPKRIRVRDESDFNGVNNHAKCCKLRADFWFKKILWATASSAIHSIIQQPEYRKKCEKHLRQTSEEKPKPLKIGFKDDPLAFLGILVDLLQEWDRYTVKKRGEAAFSDTELLQSFEVSLNAEIPKIRLRYPTDGKNWIEELEEKKLDKCLEDWREIVEIRGYNRQTGRDDLLNKNQKCAESEIWIYQKWETGF